MIIEQRRYTASAGRLDDFFALQESRGYSMVQGILQRLVGYFRTIDDGPEQIVHLWRFDDFAEWRTLLHGLYGVPELKSYFMTVRPMLARQENSFLEPCPASVLSPLWWARDWLPAAGPVFRYSSDLKVRETTLAFAPGRLPAFLDALRDLAPSADGFQHGLIGVFTTLIGRQHLVSLYRCYGGAHLPADPPDWTDWTTLDDILRELAPERSDRALKPAPFATLSPLFDLNLGEAS